MAQSTSTIASPNYSPPSPSWITENTGSLAITLKIFYSTCTHWTLYCVPVVKCQHQNNQSLSQQRLRFRSKSSASQHGSSASAAIHWVAALARASDVSIRSLSDPQPWQSCMLDVNRNFYFFSSFFIVIWTVYNRASNVISDAEITVTHFPNHLSNAVNSLCMNVVRWTIGCCSGFTDVEQ